MRRSLWWSDGFLFAAMVALAALLAFALRRGGLDMAPALILGVLAAGFGVAWLAYWQRGEMR